MPDILDFLLSQRNIDEVTEVQLDPRTVPDDLFWLQRTPVLDAIDRELTAQWRGTAVIGDIIALDSRSTVYKMLQMRFQEQEIPKIKFGAYLQERELREILTLGQAQLAATGRVPAFVRRIFSLLLQQITTGRRWRLETMIVGSILNSFGYDRMNIKFNGTWNKDPNLITTLSPGIETPATTKPITAARAMIDYARAKGVILDRYVSSRACFDQMTLSDEYQAEAQSVFASLFTLTTVPLQNREARIDAFKRMTRIEEVVFYDTHYRYENDDDTRGLQRLLPIGDMVLDSTANDNNRNRRYLGNAPVTESALIGRVGSREVAEGAAYNLDAMRSGPFTYSTVDQELEPSRINFRTVQHAWPILREPNNSAVIHAGVVTETIPVNDTF